MGKIKDEFFNVRSFITLGAFFTVYWISWCGGDPPPVIVRIVDLLLSFWFGERVGKAITAIKNGGTQ